MSFATEKNFAEEISIRCKMNGQLVFNCYVSLILYRKLRVLIVYWVNDKLPGDAVLLHYTEHIARIKLNIICNSILIKINK